MVDVKFVREMKRFIPLSELKALHLDHKAHGGPLSKIALFTSARLSVQVRVYTITVKNFWDTLYNRHRLTLTIIILYFQPLTEEEFDFIVSLEERDTSK